MSNFHRTVDSYREGARTLPREYYTSSEIFALERERIFAQHWSCVGRVSAFSKPGDYHVRSVADESLILVRDRGGELHAFFNICRHRGTQLCARASGQFSETIQCPYHAWTYALDGRLVGAPHMNEVAGFDKKNYPLHEAAVAEWEGFVFVNVNEHPQPFMEWFGPMLRRLARFDLPSLKVAHRVRYEVAANWKLVFQNYSECLHCPMIHPELSTVLPYTSGANDLTSGPFLGGYMEIKDPNESATLTGRACGRLVSVLLYVDAQHVPEHPPGLRELLHADAGRRESHDRRIRVDVQSDERGRPEVQSAGRDRFLGRHQSAGLGHLRAVAGWHRIASLSAGAVLAAREHPCCLGRCLLGAYGGRWLKTARMENGEWRMGPGCMRVRPGPIFHFPFSIFAVNYGATAPRLAAMNPLFGA
jgi:nitrite reductase/ring-hydroxylating ferredoxin subunit